MTESSSTEARELALVDKVELRIALTDTDQKFQTVLGTYLAPLLLKLASEHVSVRNKVISICQHINTRSKPQNIRLPVTALLQQFKNNPTSPLIRHFDLLYIQQGITRLNVSEIAELFPLLVSGVSKNAAGSANHGATLFNLLLRSLLVYKFPLKGSQEDLNLRTQLDVSNTDAAFLSFWFSKLLLLRLGAGGASESLGRAGLEDEEYAFLTVQGKPDVWNASAQSGLNLSEVKVAVLKCITSGIFLDVERLLPALFASADPNSRISDAAEDLIKRVVPNVSLEEQEIVETLYKYYFGRAFGASVRQSPVRPPLRVKILGLLSRSTRSTTYPDLIVKLVEKDLVPEAADVADNSRLNREGLKLQSAIVTYLSFVVRSGAPADVDAIGRPVVNLLQNFIENQTDASSAVETKVVRGRSFEVIGLLARANVSLVVEPELALLRWLFQALSAELDKDMIVSIDEALSALLRPLSSSSAIDIEPQLRKVLLHNMKDASRNARNVRFANLRFANRCLPFHDVVARFIDLYTLADTEAVTHEIKEEAEKGLDPYWYRLSNDPSNTADPKMQFTRSSFPTFEDMAMYALSEHSELTPNNGDLCALVVSFCRQILLFEALSSASITVEMSADWARKIDVMVADGKKAREAVRKHLSNVVGGGSNSVISPYWRATQDGLSAKNLVNRTLSARAALEFCSFAPRLIMAGLARETPTLLPYIYSNDIDIRSCTARTFGLLASQPSSDHNQVRSNLDTLLQKAQAWRTAAGAEANKTHGAILALSTFASHCRSTTEVDTFSTDILPSLTVLLLQILEGPADHLLVDVALTSLGQLASFRAVDVSIITKTMTLDRLLEVLTSKAKSGNERAIKALGHVSMTVVEGDNDQIYSKCEEALYSLHEIRQAETQFTVGEAMTCFLCGWESEAMVSELDFDGTPPISEPRVTLSGFIDRIIADCGTTKPSLKKVCGLLFDSGHIS